MTTSNYAQTANELRTNLLNAIAPAIAAKGFTTELTSAFSYPRLRISHPSVGVVATVVTSRLRYDGDKLIGVVTYDGRLASRRDSEFFLGANGLPNVSNLVARLRRDIPLVQKQSAEQAAYRAREASDAKVLESLPVVEGADVSVWDGQVSLKLRSLTPSQAKALLVLLAERQAELAQAAEVENDRDTQHVDR